MYEFRGRKKVKFDWPALDLILLHFKENKIIKKPKILYKTNLWSENYKEDDCKYKYMKYWIIICLGKKECFIPFCSLTTLNCEGLPQILSIQAAQFYECIHWKSILIVFDTRSGMKKPTWSNLLIAKFLSIFHSLFPRWERRVNSRA